MKKRSITLSIKNINSVVGELRKQTFEENVSSTVPTRFLIDKYQRVLDREKYRGFGRPRKIDYRCIDMWKNIKSVAVGLSTDATLDEMGGVL